MKSYVVEFRDFSSHVEHFRCEADDIPHAEEQCENAYPKCTILKVYECVKACHSNDAPSNRARVYRGIRGVRQRIR